MKQNGEVTIKTQPEVLCAYSPSVGQKKAGKLPAGVGGIIDTSREPLLSVLQLKLLKVSFLKKQISRAQKKMMDGNSSDVLMERICFKQVCYLSLCRLLNKRIFLLKRF